MHSSSFGKHNIREEKKISNRFAIFKTDNKQVVFELLKVLRNSFEEYYFGVDEMGDIKSIVIVGRVFRHDQERVSEFLNGYLMGKLA